MKQVKYLSGGKRVQNVWTDTQAGSGKSPGVAESRPHGSLNYFDGAFLPGFLWPIIMIRLVHSPYLVHLRILSCVHTYLLAKMDSTTKAYE